MKSSIMSSFHFGAWVGGKKKTNVDAKKRPELLYGLKKKEDFPFTAKKTDLKW